MGIELVKVIVVRLGPLKLSGNAHKVLVAMATTAMDRSRDGRPAARYFAGWEHLALALGHKPEVNPASAEEVVRRAIRELVSKGAIVRLRSSAHTGVRQEFALTLNEAALPQRSVGAEPGSQEGREPQRSVGVEPQQSVGVEPQRSVVKSPNDPWGPRRKEDRGRTYREEPPHETQRNHRSARDADDDPDGWQPHTYQPDESSLYCSGCSLTEHHPIHNPSRAWGAA